MTQHTPPHDEKWINRPSGALDRNDDRIDGAASRRRLLRFCHLLRAIGTRGNRSGGDRLAVTTEFSKATEQRGHAAAFVAHPETAPVLTRRQTCRLTKCPCEIGLAGKAQCESNIDQGAISLYQQRFGTLDALRADVSMGRLTYGGLECSREMEPAQAGDPCQLVNRKVAFQISLYVVQHAGQSASIQSFLCDSRDCLIRRCADMVLNQSRRQSDRVHAGSRYCRRSDRFSNQVDDRLAICVQPVAADAKWRMRTLAQPNDGAKKTPRGFEVLGENRCVVKRHGGRMVVSDTRRRPACHCFDVTI